MLLDISTWILLCISKVTCWNANSSPHLLLKPINDFNSTSSVNLIAFIPLYLHYIKKAERFADSTFKVHQTLTPHHLYPYIYISYFQWIATPHLLCLLYLWSILSPLEGMLHTTARLSPQNYNSNYATALLTASTWLSLYPECHRSCHGL